MQIIYAKYSAKGHQIMQLEVANYIQRDAAKYLQYSTVKKTLVS